MNTKTKITKRYFMVFYVAATPSGLLTGQSTFVVEGEKPFLNKKATEKQLKDNRPEAYDFTLTGFTELKKYEYDRWIEQ